MKKRILEIFVAIMLITLVFILSGCTLKIETTDNSISASVDGETTEKVDGIIDWIKERIQRIFVTEETSDTSNNSTTKITNDFTTKITSNSDAEVI